jgi:hypothetical protein
MLLHGNAVLSGGYTYRFFWVELITLTLFFGPVSSRTLTRIAVTGRGGPEHCEMLRFPHFLDIRLTDGDKVVSPTRRPPFTPKNIPGTHFC